MGFVNLLFTPHSNEIVIKDNLQLAMVKSRVDFEKDLGFNSGGLEDRKIRWVGSVLGTTSLVLVKSQQDNEANFISLEPKNGLSVRTTSGSRGEQ